MRLCAHATDTHRLASPYSFPSPCSPLLPHPHPAAGTPANPLLACILEALGEPGAGVQASAIMQRCRLAHRSWQYVPTAWHADTGHSAALPSAQAAAAAALAQVADYLGPLDPALLRLLLHALNNPLCGGRAELCGALARLEAGRVRGLVGPLFHQILAAWPEVLGSAGGERAWAGACWQAPRWPGRGGACMQEAQAGMAACPEVPSKNLCELRTTPLQLPLSLQRAPACWGRWPARARSLGCGPLRLAPSR